MDNNEEPDARYDWHDTVLELSTLYARLREIAGRLPELPTITVDERGYLDCVCTCGNDESWTLYESGYEMQARAGYDDDRRWYAELEGIDSFTLHAEGPEVIACNRCGEVYRRPDDLYYHHR